MICNLILRHLRLTLEASELPYFRMIMTLKKKRRYCKVLERLSPNRQQLAEKRTLISSLVASILCLAGCSQNIVKTNLDAYFDTLASDDKFMGSVAVIQNNELIYSKSVGFADIEHGIKADENTKYRIASISKTFTAVLIQIGRAHV